MPLNAKAMSSRFKGTLATPTVVRALHMPTSRLTLRLRKSFNFMPLFKKCFVRLFSILCLPCGARDARCSKLVAELSAGSVLLLNTVSKTLCCLSVAGCSSWDLHTMCTSLAVACHRQKPTERPCMT